MTTAPHRHEDPADPRAWARHAHAALEGAGYRRGGARRAVIDALAAEGCTVSAIELDERLRNSGRRVGRARRDDRRLQLRSRLRTMVQLHSGVLQP